MMTNVKSIFGPLLLVAAGVVWLLIYTGTIPSTNLWALTHIWPFVLILAGVGLILRHFWKYIAWLVDVVIVGGAVLAIIFAPQLGWTNPSIFSFVQNGEPYFGPGEPGSGHIVTESREVKDFSSIEVSYPAQITVQQGKLESLKIEAEDNVLPGLKTQVMQGDLEIFYKSEDGKHVNPTHPVKITIIVKDLTKVNFSSAGELTIINLETQDLDLALSGAGNLKLDNINVQNLAVGLSGAGSLTASGTADNLKLNISGVGSYHGADMDSKTARVNISGMGSATIWAEDELTASISGAGSVNYYGSPRVTKNISGLGSVTHSGNK
jgi:hypothetical protein